ncbi:DUF1810 domain-containing protein [Sphingomonas sp.]|jgi:uncharacterized protein (DUF1810 family)|uniref:DUF1810 domain-containing protein n=1 Tax=Sphingomonas sp. TaxID=28214 RepID=UPI002E3225C4|nr:DUF1810 domain-containing protein [Sphingomonas sp.]HEX4695090.1 DUF1810 domain-containing protein [Sphingomonas sp.]
MNQTPSDLDRFVAAQDGVFDRALAELCAGAKTSHWMWFVFPQIAGLGHSAMARMYAIRDLAEARAYLDHPMLGARLAAASEAMLGWAGRRSAEAILGGIDAVKFRSSMTLFEAAAGAGAAPYAACLDAFHGGRRDPATIERL